MKHLMNKIAVLGSGVMGAGIAALLAGVGINVILLDIVPFELKEEEKAKGMTFDDIKVRNRLAQDGKNRVCDPKNNIAFSAKTENLIQIGNFSDDLHLIGECDWIIEVVAENLKIKKNLMEQVYKYWKEGIIVSTNTSGIEIGRITEGMSKEFKSYFLGTHFFNPPRHMKLLEIIPLIDTCDEVVESILEFGQKVLGKGVIKAKDTPCFVANRIGAYVYAATFKAMKKYDFNIRDVDQITGIVMGRPRSATFKTTDIVGIDTFVNVFKNLHSQLDGTEEKEDFLLPVYVQYLQDKKYLGDKSKQGFYKKVNTTTEKNTLTFNISTFEYENIENKILKGVVNAEKEKTLDKKLKKLVAGDSDDCKFAWDVIKNILLYSASKVPEITDDYENIDKAMRWGYNWTMGPFKIWDAIGVNESTQRMKKEGCIVPKWVDEMLASGKENFYDKCDDCNPIGANIIIKDDESLLTEIGDDVVKFTFKTKGNTITDNLLDRLNEAIEKTENKYMGMVICNEGKNFSAGFNLNEIYEVAEKRDWKSMDVNVQKLQDALMRVKYAKGYIVTAPFGMTVGAGAELVMSSHGVTPFAETYMGLVETSVGLVPGGGGAKEYLFRAMENNDKFEYVQTYSAIKNIWNLISSSKVTSSAHEACERNMMSRNTNIIMNAEALVEQAKNMVMYMIENNAPKPTKKDIKILGTKGKAALMNDINFMKEGKVITEHDAYVAEKVAWIVTGGDLLCGSVVDEQYILNLEREAFVELCGHQKTRDRIQNMLKTGKSLRN